MLGVSLFPLSALEIAVQQSNFPFLAGHQSQGVLHFDTVGAEHYWLPPGDLSQVGLHQLVFRERDGEQGTLA